MRGIVMFFGWWLLFIGGNHNVQCQRLVFLNSTKCVSDENATCYSNNVLGFYLALDLLLESEEGPAVTSADDDDGNIPSFSMARNEMVEILWQLPPVALRFLGISTYVNTLSDGTSVFAEVAPPWDHMQIAKQCNLDSPELLWGSVVRLLLSPNTDSVNQIPREKDGICTLILPVTGTPYTNLTQTDFCEREENHTVPITTPTMFSVVIRLTLPENSTELNLYVADIGSKSKVMIHQLEKDFSCSSPVFGYPDTVTRPNVTSEVYDDSTVRSFKLLVEKVVESVFLAQPQADIRSSNTIPWITDGFTCINKSITCQGSTSKSSYERSDMFNLSTTTSSVIVIGCIHHDFLNTSFYSSMSFYKLMNESDVASGAGISSVVDSDQRSSATGFFPRKPAAALDNMDNMDHFFVVQFGYSCLQLASSALCRNFTTKEVLPGSSVFVVGRTYATPAGPLADSLLRDVVMFVQY